MATRSRRFAIEKTAEDIADRLNENENQREEDRWSA